MQRPVGVGCEFNNDNDKDNHIDIDIDIDNDNDLTCPSSLTPASGLTRLRFVGPSTASSKLLEGT